MGLTDERIFRQIEQTETLGALWALVVRYVRAQGFDALAYVLLDRDNRGQVVAMLEYGFPPEMLNTYAALGYGRNDAVLRVAMATGQPVLRSTLPQHYKLSREEAWHRHVLDGLGVGELLALPLYGPNGRNAMASVTRPRPGVIETADFVALQVVAQAAHLKGLSMRPAEPAGGHGLSLREVEILRWVAQGKSNGVIADILAISAGTVDTYLRRIFEKLDVTDRTSAAVRGVGMGIIRP